MEGRCSQPPGRSVEMKYSSRAVHRRASTRQRCRSGAAPTDRIGPREHLRQPAASPLVRD